MKVTRETTCSFLRGTKECYRAEYHGYEEWGETAADAIVALCRYLRNNDLV
jgi:hypothetical protein